MNAAEISRSGLDIEWQRLQIIAQNLANVNTTRTASGGAYVPQRLVTGPVEAFQTILNRSGDAKDYKPNGVMIYGVEPTTAGTKQVFEPNHPHANQEGFVTYPNISHAEEMTMMIKTSRAYEANLVAMAAAQQMYSSALQIGRQR